MRAPNKTVALTRAIRRAKRRGAALVEAVVAIPFFLIVFASIVFIGQSYSKKMQMMRESREKVWAYASTNCGTRGDSAGGPGADTAGVALGSEDNGANGNGMNGASVDTSSAGQVGNAPHADVINKDLGSATITAESSVTGSGLIGGVTAKQASYRKVMCNEPPYDGDLKGAVSAAFHDITGW